MPLFNPALRPGGRLDLGGVPIRLRVDGRARRISLRIDPANREVIATAPRSRDLGAALQFARTRRAWAIHELERLGPKRSIAAGRRLTLFGEPYVVLADGRGSRLVRSISPDGVRALAGCEGVADPALVVRAIRQLATERFTAVIADFCGELGVEPPRLALADAKSRWGSCTPARLGRRARLRMSWRLALAPLEVATYVAAHECAHLLEPNHGPGFWSEVERLVGDPNPQRAWLRTEGAALHAFASG